MTKGDVFFIHDFDGSKLAHYQTVIFGSFTHTGKMKSIEFIKKHWSILQDKPVMVFATSGTPFVDPKERKIIAKILSSAARGRVACSPLPGAYSYHQLDWKDKLLMNRPRWKLLFQRYFVKDPEAAKNLRNFYIPQDRTSKDALTPLFTFLNTKSKEPKALRPRGLLALHSFLLRHRNGYVISNTSKKGIGTRQGLQNRSWNKGIYSPMGSQTSNKTLPAYSSSNVPI